ncbi:Transcriptional activator of fatty acid utilization [Chytridiales sp. JEL 0842]|nr:Transcriptional activator of fatty acid utilization [Chytridiales sp. JEL 0842]
MTNLMNEPPAAVISELAAAVATAPSSTSSIPDAPLSESGAAAAEDSAGGGAGGSVCRKKRIKCSGDDPCTHCVSFGLECAYTTPQKKRGPQKRTAVQAAPAPKAPSTLERLKNVEALLTTLIQAKPGSAEEAAANGESESNIVLNADGSATPLQHLTETTPIDIQAPDEEAKQQKKRQRAKDGKTGERKRRKKAELEVLAGAGAEEIMKEVEGVKEALIREALAKEKKLAKETLSKEEKLLAAAATVAAARGGLPIEERRANVDINGFAKPHGVGGMVGAHDPLPPTPLSASAVASNPTIPAGAHTSHMPPNASPHGLSSTTLSAHSSAPNPHPTHTETQVPPSRVIHYHPPPTHHIPHSGFRGIALSLQRKMRRGIKPTHGSATPPESSQDLVQVSSSGSSGAHNTERTVVEDLASDTILFYGSTSTTTSSAWRQSPRFAGGVMSISLSFEATPSKDDSNWLVDTPPCSPDLVLHLVGLYFSHVHPYFPMIDRHAFARQFKEKRTEHFALLLNSMCALMTQQTRDVSLWSTSPSHVELHNAFFERARVLVGRQFDWPHINNVQALLLLCMVGQGTNINASSYHYLGIAHRQAVEMGMHRNLDNLHHPNLSPALRQSMRATWFCLYILDRYTSVVEGRPMAISDEEWDTPFPSGEDQDLLHLKFHVGLCEILGRIANYVNRPGKPPGVLTRPPGYPSPLTSFRPYPTDPKAVVNELGAQLISWKDALPSYLKARPGAGSIWGFHHHLYGVYHTAWVLLRRLDTGHFDGECVRHAEEIGYVLEFLPAQTKSSGASSGLKDDGGKAPESPEGGPMWTPGFVFVMPLIVYSALTSATLFLDMVLASHHHQQQPPQTPGSVTGGNGGVELVGAKELQRALVAFERLKDTSLFASYYGQLCVEVLRSKGICLETYMSSSSAQAQSARASPEETMPGTHSAVPPQEPQQQKQPSASDPVSQLRAAAKAAVAAQQASQAAAALRASRLGLHPTSINPMTTPTSPPLMHPNSSTSTSAPADTSIPATAKPFVVPSGAAVPVYPRTPDTRRLVTKYPNAPTTTASTSSTSTLMHTQSPQSSLGSRVAATVDPHLAETFAQSFGGVFQRTNSGGSTGSNSLLDLQGAATTPSETPQQGVHTPTTGLGNEQQRQNVSAGYFDPMLFANLTPDGGVSAGGVSTPGTNPPPFFSDSVFSDLLGPLVDYSIWQELAGVMGGSWGGKGGVGLPQGGQGDGK